MLSKRLFPTTSPTPHIPYSIAKYDYFNHKRTYLAVCCVVRNSNTDGLNPPIREWIEYHRKLGIEKFYLFDENSTVPVLDHIIDYVRADLVDYVFVAPNRKPFTRYVIYKSCISRFGERHKWMAFLDADEFIVVKEPNVKIPTVLGKFEAFGGLSLNWMLIGTSDPSSSIDTVDGSGRSAVSNYHKCRPTNVIRTIINLNHTLGIKWNPFSFIYAPGYSLYRFTLLYFLWLYHNS